MSINELKQFCNLPVKTFNIIDGVHRDIIIDGGLRYVVENQLHTNKSKINLKKHYKKFGIS